MGDSFGKLYASYTVPPQQLLDIIVKFFDFKCAPFFLRVSGIYILFLTLSLNPSIDGITVCLLVQNTVAISEHFLVNHILFLSPL